MQHHLAAAVGPQPSLACGHAGCGARRPLPLRRLPLVAGRVACGRLGSVAAGRRRSACGCCHRRHLRQGVEAVPLGRRGGASCRGVGAPLGRADAAGARAARCGDREPGCIGRAVASPGVARARRQGADARVAGGGLGAGQWLEHEVAAGRPVLWLRHHRDRGRAHRSPDGAGPSPLVRVSALAHLRVGGLGSSAAGCRRRRGGEVPSHRRVRSWRGCGGRVVAQRRECGCERERGGAATHGERSRAAAAPAGS